METWGGMGLEQLCIAETHLWSSHLFPIYAPQLLVHNPHSKPTAFPPFWCPVQVTAGTAASSGLQQLWEQNSQKPGPT